MFSRVASAAYPPFLLKKKKRKEFSIILNEREERERGGRGKSFVLPCVHAAVLTCKHGRRRGQSIAFHDRRP